MQQIFLEEAPHAAPSSAKPLLQVAAGPSSALHMSAASIWRPFDAIRMSDAERRAAIDALLLGRDIGRGLRRVRLALRRGKHSINHR